MKTPAQANAKWTASTQVGEQTWVDNLSNTTKPIVQSAIAARGRMQTGFATATQPGGVWERHLQDVGDAGIKQAAKDKRGNYTTGVNQGKDKQLASITKIINYESANLPTIEQMKQQGQDGKARMNAWYDIMKSARGTLGADA